MDLPGENPADVGSASPATPPAIRVSASAHEVPGGAAAAGSPPPSSSRALRAVAKRFVGAYYDHLNASPSRVARYYTEDSVFTVEDGSTPTPRGRTGKQSGNEPENQQRDEAELDFYDSGPESPMRRLLATAPSASGTDGIIARRQRLFKHRHARVVSTDVQTIPGGNVLAVVLGTLSRRDATANSRAGSSSGAPRRGKEVTFMHSFVLRLRRGVGGGSTTKSDETDDRGIAEKSDGEATGIQSQSYAEWAVDAEAPPRDVDDFVIVNEVFRRVDPVDSNSPAATAATVLAAAMSPPPTPPRATTPEEGNERLVARANRGAAGVAGEDVAARLAATATTPRKDPAVASPNPFVNEREDSFFETPETSTKGEQHEGHGFGEPSARSPDARAIPLPSPGLLSRPGSSEHRLRRVASRYDPNGAASDEDGPGRVSRALAFEQEKTSDGPGRVVDSHEKSRDVDRANRGARAKADRSPRTESAISNASESAREPSQSESARAFVGPPSARVTREHRERRRVYSSASSSPAMSAAAGGSSTHHSPFRDGDGSVAKDSPLAKRGLGFASERVGSTVVRDGWDPNFAGSPMAGVPREAQRLVTLSERSDEGSQGAHSMSVSVSSQPSVSGVNSEDGDRESSHPRDDDRSLREFPVDELEPVNLDDVRVFRMQHPRGAFSGHSSRRSSPAATPSRRNSRRHDGARAEGLGFDDAYATRAAGFRTDYPNRDAYGGNGARAYDRGAYDARGYATRAYHSARASPVVSREGPRIPPGVGGTRAGPTYARRDPRALAAHHRGRARAVVRARGVPARVVRAAVVRARAVPSVRVSIRVIGSEPRGSRRVRVVEP